MKKVIDLERQADGSYAPSRRTDPRQATVKRQNLQNANLPTRSALVPSAFEAIDAIEEIGAQALREFDLIRRRLGL